MQIFINIKLNNIKNKINFYFRCDLKIIQIEKIEQMMHQNKKINVTGLKSPSKINLVRSKSTDQLTSTHKYIGRKHNNQKNLTNDISAIKISNLSKSKSMKSLKAKNKSSTKTVQNKSNKKIKPKQKKNCNSQSDCKTIKKAKNIVKANLSEQSFNSQPSLKPQPLQYFFYHNTYIPIQNSAQRRFVFKIKQIDQRNQETADTFFKRTNQSALVQKDESFILPKKEIIMIQNGIITQKTPIAEYGTNTTPRNQKQISMQTQNNKFQQDIKKCFSTTLNDLEFLFLPDQNNFQGFSKAQRVHYKQLFQSIAQKIWTNGQTLQQLTDDKVQILVYQRQCIQMGLIQYYPQQGFPTHIFSVMSYLTNLFSYAEMNEQNEALQKIHSIYGFSYQQRLSRLLRGFPTRKKCSPILSQDLFLSLQKQLFKDHDFGSQLIQKSVHIHNKALFDAANEQLQKFKPFYYSKGQPFPWSINVGMTFFSIDSSTIGLLFKQIKQKILMKFGYLCGILLDYDQFKQTPNKQKHPLHIKKLQQHELKMINDQIKDQKFDSQMEQADTTLKADLSTWILADIIDQLCNDMVNLV